MQRVKFGTLQKGQFFATSNGEVFVNSPAIGENQALCIDSHDDFVGTTKKFNNEDEVILITKVTFHGLDDETMIKAALNRIFLIGRN